MTVKTASHKKFFGSLLFVVLLVLAGIQPGVAAPAGPEQQAPSVTLTDNPVVVDGACPGPPGIPAPILCEPVGVTATITAMLIADLKLELVASSNLLESYLNIYITAVVQAEYVQIDWLEKSMISWWDTMWYYGLLPSYKQMTKQLNVLLAQQAMQLHENADAANAMEYDRAISKHAIEDQAIAPHEQVCVAATGTSGFTRATSFSRVMRQAWEAKSVAAGLNQKKDSDGNIYPGATSASGSDQKRFDDWKNIFCDPQGNSTSAVPCGSNADKNLTNADVLPVKYLFNTLTLNVDDKTDGKNLELGIEYLINNLVGLPTMDAVVPTVFGSSDGRGDYLKRRSYLARYAAVRSVPDMIASWRIPGSQMSKWIADLRESAGVSSSLMQDTNNNGLVLTGSISKNPSYKEIMHALSVDRFNSGQYANQMITDPVKVDLEKLNISVFYLMQLRDYYELLERTALTLAVQVTVLADQQKMEVPIVAAPTGAGKGQ